MSNTVDEASHHAGNTDLAADIVVGQPSTQFEIAEPAEPAAPEEEIIHPSGTKLWLNMTAVSVCVFLRGFDLTIISITNPILSNEFNTVSDIGWYSAAYLMMNSATILFFSKMFTLFNNKSVFLASIVIFFAGLNICTFANSSKLFIFGRALLGMGAAYHGTGMMAITAQSFPLHKRAIALGILNFVQTGAMILSPPIGGLFITHFGWRVCFGVNIPLLFLAFLFSCYG